MSIRLRLILSYLAMILVPVIFFILTTMLMNVILLKGSYEDIHKLYMPSKEGAEVSEEEQEFKRINLQFLENPDQFEDLGFIREMDNELKPFGTSIIFKVGDNILYRSVSLDDVKLENLPAFGIPNEKYGLSYLDNRYVSVMKLDFYLSDHSEGSVIFLKDAGKLVSFLRFYSPAFMVLLILILIGTNGLLTYFVSRSIIRHVNELKNAAEEIKEGNLSRSIDIHSKDEIGQLARAFEEMRVRLKESVEIQAAYEENRKELIANISHDLKTPITTIKGYVEGIRDGVANSPEKLNRYLDTIYMKSKEMDHLIDQLFLYSKLDLQKVPFHFENILFDQFLLDYVEELRFDLEEQGFNIVLDIERDKDYKILGDREQLKRVIANLVGNSLKYMDKTMKEMTFRLSAREGFLLFELHDNGPGIPKDKLPFIFNRFYRIDDARSSITGGSGLGLSIARRIIEEHKGDIWAESSGGEGMSVFIKLNCSEKGHVTR